MALAILREPDAKNIFQPLEGSPGWVRYPPIPNDADCRHDRGGTVGQRLKQMEINCRWLMDITDRIHDALCPGQYGTWQDRAKQAVEAAERLASNAAPHTGAVAPSVQALVGNSGGRNETE